MTIALIAAFRNGPAEGADGAALFAQHCARCHGESGKAETPSARALKVRPLAGDGTLAKMPTADIVAAIRSDLKHRGVGAPLELNDAEIEAVAVFVKQIAATPP